MAGSVNDNAMQSKDVMTIKRRERAFRPV